MEILKKIIKISVIIFVLSSFILALNTHGAFGVEVGQVIKYKITKARNTITFEHLEETFAGYMVNDSIYEEDTTVKVTIESITASELKWNATIGGTPITEIVPETFPIQTYRDFLMRGTDLYYDATIGTIYSSGEIEPLYFDPFPLFMDTASVSWDVLEGFVTYQYDELDLNIGIYVVDEYGSSYTDANDIVTMNWWYTFEWFGIDPWEPDILYNCSTSFSYGKTTGMLLHLDAVVNMTGEHQNTPYTALSEYSIEQTDVSDFAEFLSEYKWYFIGGGGGLIVLTVTSIIVIRVIKRR